MAEDPVKTHDILAPIIEETYARLERNEPVMFGEMRKRLEAAFQKTGHRTDRKSVV